MFADHLSPLLKDIFPDSKIAQGYASGKTKTASIVNGAIAPELKQTLVSQLQSGPFSMCIDGSNNTGLEKMNPITVKLFDVNRGRVVTRFLDMCLTSGVQAATAESIFNEMGNGIEWSNCVGVGVDNTSVDIGCNNSIKTRVL